MKKILFVLITLWALTSPLKAGCNKTHKIKHVPYVITKPGNYILCRDVQYDGNLGTDGIGAAIKIESSNVKLCLFAHSITVTDSTAIGIWVNNPNTRICEIDINNDAIQGTGFAGIHIANACKVRLNNMFTIGHSFGLLIDGLSSDIRIEDSEFSGAAIAGSQINSGNFVTFSNSVFNNNMTGLQVFSSTSTKIFGCSFPNSLQNNLVTSLSNGLLVENSSFTRNQSTADDLVLIGSPSPSSDSRFEGCSFIAKSNGISGINFASGKGLIVNSCLFDVSSIAGDTTEYSTLLVAATSSDALVTGCTFQSTDAPSTDNRTATKVSGTNVRFEDCLMLRMSASASFVGGSGTTANSCSVAFSQGSAFHMQPGAANAITDCTMIQNDTSQTTSTVLFTGSTNCVLSGNTILQSGVNGVRLTAGSSSNTIIDNVVIDSPHDGIIIDTGCTDNTCQNNTVLESNSFGIENVDAADITNKFYSNTALNNGTDYSTTIPTQLTPGDAEREGSNIIG